MFDILYNILKNKISAKQNIIIDATNITIKSRKKLITVIRQYEKQLVLQNKINIIAYIMTTPIEICITNDKKRERHVGSEIIYTQCKNFQIPFYEEDIDKIIINEYDERKETTQEHLELLINGMEDFDQKTHYHKYDLLTHCSKVYQLLHEVNADKCLQIAGILHDIGKMETQTLDTISNECSYYGHASVGTYQLLEELKLPETHQPNKTSLNNTLDTLFYINYHMLPFSWNTPKALTKNCLLFGEYKFNNLILLHKCDTISTGIVLK